VVVLSWKRWAIAQYLAISTVYNDRISGAIMTGTRRDLGSYRLHVVEDLSLECEKRGYQLWNMVVGLGWKPRVIAQYLAS
jgi:hypothetical protein